LENRALNFVIKYLTMSAKGKHLENVMLMPVKDVKRPKVRTKPKKGFT